jgi:hypothetical protein
MRRTLAAIVATIVALLPALPAHAGTSPPNAATCPVFPADNVWNTDISALPVAPQSAAWLASMSAGSTNLHPDFGSSGDPNAPYGIPYTVVTDAHPKVSVSFEYADESDPGPYPFGADTPIEGGTDATGDRHAIMVDSTTCTLYELYDATYSPSGSTAGSGAIWSLTSDALRPAGWTSADAAGLPIFPGLLRPDEVAAGVITHAIRFTAAHTDTSYIWPARHEAGETANPDLPPMGARFRLKASFDISHYSANTQVVLRAMQHYGMILADNGSNWYFQGAASNDWDPTMIAELKTIPASAFDAVDESSLMVDPNSAAVRTTAAPQAPGGYRLVASDGGMFTFGDATFKGSLGNVTLAAPIIGAAATRSGEGYWMLGADGGVFSFGDAPSFGSAAGRWPGIGAAAIAATPDGGGYWVVSRAGAIANFGDAPPLPAVAAGSPVVGAAVTGAGHALWIATSSGAVLIAGPATPVPIPSLRPASPVIGMAATADGHGFWLVASDGGVFSFGDAAFHGSTGGMHLNRPVVGIAATPTGGGYWLVASDGGIFSFGDAAFHGSTGGMVLNKPIVAMMPTT